MDEMRFHPAAELQVMAAIAEFCGGWALLFGIATRLAAALISGDMLVAIAAVHLPAHQPFVASHGASMELPVVYLIGTIAIIIAGPGRWSVDAFIAHHAHWRRHARRDRITA
jgi:putative oxidoreductase